jgi:uncharacterized protein
LKFQPDHMDGVNAITRHESDRVWVQQTPFKHSILIPWTGPVQEWPARALTDLTAAHFEQLLPLAPELVLFGSGVRHAFAHPSLYKSLIEKRIGLETMDTAAACRTYNVLVSEGRKVIAALLI